MIIDGLTAFVYDIEIFPNFFSCTVKNTESGNIRTFEISDRKNDIGEIYKLFLNKKIIWVTYNGIHYDNAIISYIILNIETLIKKPVWEINKELKELSDLIIESQDNTAKWRKYKYANLFKGLDLMTMMFAKMLRVGLKELQVTMEYHNVREYEGDFNSNIPISEFDNVISYNINDVNSTEKLMNIKEGEIRLRESIKKTFGIDVLNQDGVNLGVEIIKNNYLRETGKSWNDIKDLRSPCDELDLKDIIFDFIQFDTPEFKKLHKEVLETHLNLKEEKLKNQKDRWKKTVYINDLEITYSLGGIHTRNNPDIYRSDNQWVIIDSDCALKTLAHVKSLKLREYPKANFTADISNNYCSRYCNKYWMVKTN